ncbi:hypothetical protein [Frigoribacterium sp. Leaf186]|uniref:hypothetical protein n=1 Tax=Frigoribacterium sp. Leaf186 TaxID=1736293 RepID=UPI000AF3796F|nr:hypothetical protein [Frigoribacterium sp. Leaf186]
MATKTTWTGAFATTICLVSLTGCVATTSSTDPASNHPTMISPTSPPATGGTLVDPLTRLEDPDSDAFLATTVSPSLHEHGTGAATFDVARPDPSLTQLRFYIACAAGEFTVTLGTFYSGDCTPDFTSSGTIPLPSGEDPLSVRLDVSVGTDYWITAIPVP